MKSFRFFFSILICSCLFGYNDRIVATVGDEIILKSDILFKIQMFEMQGMVNSDDGDIYQLMLDDEINNLVLLGLAKQDTNIIISDQEIESMTQEQLSNMINQAGGSRNLKNIYGTRMEQIKKNIRAQVSNMLSINMYSSLVASKVTTSSKDVLDFYNTYKDSLPQMPDTYSYSIVHMPYTPSEEDLNSAKDFLLAIKDSIGTNYSLFDSFAKKYSEDPGSKNAGGLLPEARRGDFVPEYERAVFDMPIGSVSNPVLSDFGYHLIYLLSRSGEKYLTKHILVRQKNNSIDPAVFEQKLLSLQNTFKSNVGGFDSLSYSYSKQHKNLSGVYENIAVDQIPESVINTLKTTDSMQYSSVVDLGDSCFILYKKEFNESRFFDIKQDWLYLQNFTLNQKREDFLIEHINKNKERVSIVIYND